MVQTRVASPVAVVVIVAAGQAHEAWATSLSDAAMGAGATRVIVEDAGPLADEQALALAARDNADAVALVAWDEDHSRATVHLHRAGESRWLDRGVAFQVADAPAERGRTIGFALASMLPDSPPMALPPPSSTVAPPPAEQPKPPPPHVWHGAVDASGQGTVAVGGYGGGVGATLAGHWYFVPHLSARLGLGIRSGDVSPAQATALLFTGSLGLGFRFIEAIGRQPFGFGGRIAFLLMNQSLSHLSADNASAEQQSRWLPGAELMLEGALHFVPSAAVLIALGTEVAMGETHVYVADRPVATLAPWRLVGEVGLRARF